MNCEGAQDQWWDALYRLNMDELKEVRDVIDDLLHDMAEEMIARNEDIYAGYSAEEVIAREHGEKANN